MIHDLIALIPWPRRSLPQSLGKRGELAAAHFLRRLGYRIVAQGHRNRFGELDLIAVDGKTVVFAEVKTLKSNEFGNPAEAVDDQKQRQLTRLAMEFLKQHALLENPARFDVLSVTWPDNSRKPTIQHIKHAFQATGHGQFFT